MCTKSKTEIFIEKAKLVHGDKYGYSLVEYVNSATKVLVICDKHFPKGFLTAPYSHISAKSGCPKCGVENRVIFLTKSVNEFIDKSNLRFANKFDYTKVKYVNINTSVTIICPIHGEFSQKPILHLSSKFGCRKCGHLVRANDRRLPFDEFIYKANIIHNYVYDYNEVSYTNNKMKIKIFCKKHTTYFYQNINSHLRGCGCPKCGKLVTNNKIRGKLDNFIHKANLVHNYSFDYRFVEYINCYTPVNIVCKKHDTLFHQAPSGHLKSSGCKQCTIEIWQKKLNNGIIGWTDISWINSAKHSVRFESFKVYIIKCWNDDEIFYKIGKTYQTIKSRFNGIKNMPYNYDIIKIFEGDGDSMSYLERFLQKMNKIDKYLPIKTFGGRYECYSSLCDETLNYVFE
jgi:hypothetical protein